MATYSASEAVVGPRDFARVINNIFLSLNFIGRVKEKRNDVTEIVSELEIADVIFRRYDQKYVCCSQAIKGEVSRKFDVISKPRNVALSKKQKSNCLVLL